jgi:hypothetical protein
MHENARDFVILSEFCKMFYKTLPSRNHVAGGDAKKMRQDCLISTRAGAQVIY